MNTTQKLLLGLVATASVFSSFAENEYYVTAGAGVAMQSKLSSFDTKDAAGADHRVTFKKAKIGSEILLGAGYYFAENLRAEAVFVKPFLGASKVSVDGKSTDKKASLQVNSLQLRGYYDVLPIADIGKMYVGAGLGWAQVSGKANVNGESYKAKNKNNLVWTVGLGASFDVADGAKIGLEYNYQDFGKAKKAANVNYAPKAKAHAILAKLTFSL
jgi:opacity protein-like surface antigen